MITASGISGTHTSGAGMTETPWESSPEDVAEQRAEVVPDDHAAPQRTASIPWDVNPADAAEQDVEVPLDEDDWR
jgi:hypothetical protein